MVSRVWQVWLAKILVLALVYYGFGRAALWLAIPPGYAMAIYPPAGVGLAAVLIGGYRMALGVALGSLSLNLWIGSSSPLTMSALLIAGSIAIGAMVQAMLGSWLLRRVVGYPAALDSNTSILTFMLIGGPVSCLINASVGVGALYGFGVMQQSQVVTNWVTWWAGDALGVLILTPICMILFAEPVNLWRSRRFNVLFPMLITLCAVVSAFLLVRQWEVDEFRTEFRDTASRLANALQTRLDYHVEVQKSVVSLFNSVNGVNRKQFASFVTEPVSTYAALQAIEWAPRIRDSERASFETGIRKEGFPDFAITEHHGQGMMAASKRAEYYPVTFAAPFLGNERALGFDLASDWLRQQTINEARDVAIPVASEPVRLVQQAGGPYASLLISALYDPLQPHQTREQRRLAVSSLVLSVLRLGDVLDGLLSQEDRTHIGFRLHDAVTPASVAPYFDTVHDSSTPPLYTTTLTFAGRELKYSATPLEPYLADHRSWAAWSAMVGGMMFTCLVGMYLLFASGRSYNVEVLVTERTRALNESEHRLHAILDNAAEGIMTFAASGPVLLANRAARNLLGYPDASLIGQSFDRLFLDMPLEPAGPQHLFREIIARRADGSQFDVGLSLARLERDGQLLFIAVIHDVTEKKRVERLKGEFVSAVSHELRTPLTSIRGSLGLLAGGAAGTIPESAKKLLQLANDNAERLSNLINDILDFERLEYGGMLFKMEPHRIMELVHKAMEINQGYAQKFSIRLVLVGAQSDAWTVLADSNRLIQVLTNLISNAIKFSLPDGQVEISACQIDDTIQISVIDHGIGIPEAFQKQIFSKFSQADGSQRRKYAGTGLGLSLSKSMIEKMQGHIDFESTEGKGAHFFVRLPLIDP